MADTHIDQAALVVLVCSGLECCRQDDEAFNRTSLLIFVVVLLVYHGKGQEARSGSSPESYYQNLHDMLSMPGTGSDGEMIAWALGRGLSVLENGTLDDVALFAPFFYRATERLMQLDALKQAIEGCEEEEEDTQFLSLSLHGLNDGIRNAIGAEDPRVATVVAAADSEAGQIVLRDLYLSFVLPIGFLGVRRGLLIPREVAHLATAEHPEHTQAAHEVAMAGAAWLYENSDDELRKLVSVLAGLACLTTREGEDPIRKGTAFGGRVNLPFLEARAPSDVSTVRLVLDRWANRWTLYRVCSGKVEVVGGGLGYQGLATSAVGMLPSL